MQARTGILATAAVLLLAPLAVLSAAPPAPTATADAKPTKAVTKCERVTGSRIRPAKTEKGCAPTIGPFRSYTQEELQRTGEIDMNEALRKIDPIFR